MANQLDFYYITNIYQLPAAVKYKLQFPYFETTSKYGNALILQTKPTNNLTSTNNVALQVHLESLDNVKFVKNYEALASAVRTSTAGAGEYAIFNGIYGRFGEKYIPTYVTDNEVYGLRVIEDDILVIYNKQIIKGIKIYEQF